MAKYKFISDPGHGWLEVTRGDIASLNIGDKISQYSYVNGQYVYLEEDCDAQVYIEAAGLTREDIVEVYEENTAIREYSPFK